MRFRELYESNMNGLTTMSLETFLSHSGDISKEVEMDTENDMEAITEADEFGLGASYRDVPDEEMNDYLGRTKNKEKTKKDNINMPYIHQQNIQIKDENGKDYDLEALKAAIKKRPTSILKQNQKMKHSNGSATVFFNVGLPALVGLAVNEQTNKFVVVQTCPQASKCVHYCYARKGSYIQFKEVSMKNTKVLNFLLNEPDKFKKVLASEIMIAQNKFQDGETDLVVRWHDSGDMFSNEYLALAYDIARQFPDVKFYAYTKIAGVAINEKPDNFIINFSEGAKPDQEKKVDFVQIKNSRVVPSELFMDLIQRDGRKFIRGTDGTMQFKSEEAEEEFKQRLADKYKLDPRTVISYDEMMEFEDSGKPRWKVYIKPGQGDNAAMRKDVVSSLLLLH